MLQWEGWSSDIVFQSVWVCRLSCPDDCCDCMLLPQNGSSKLIGEFCTTLGFMLEAAGNSPVAATAGVPFILLPHATPAVSALFRADEQP